MKFIRKSLIIFSVIISISTSSKAGLEAHFWIYSIDGGVDIKFYFNERNLLKSDGGYKIVSVLRASAVLDSFIIGVSLPKIRIKSLSFSRNDTTYCYANRFPPSDSLKWRLWMEDTYNDTLKLQDSVLELKSETYNPHGVQVIWHLKKKYTFNTGDIFSLVLAEFPYIPPVKALPHNEYMLKSGNLMKSKMLILVDGYPSSFLTGEQIHFPLFDISGKRMLFAPKRSFIFILPTVGK